VGNGLPAELLHPGERNQIANSQMVPTIPMIFGHRARTVRQRVSFGACLDLDLARQRRIVELASALRCIGEATRSLFASRPILRHNSTNRTQTFLIAEGPVVDQRHLGLPAGSEPVIG
jgi:hypothetical protein